MSDMEALGLLSASNSAYFTSAKRSTKAAPIPVMRLGFVEAKSVMGYLLYWRLGGFGFWFEAT